MQSTPWTAYTARMAIEGVTFAAMLLLFVFAVTLIGVGGFYFLRVFHEYFRSKPFAAFEKKAAAAIQAADMGWVAIVCGPLLAALISLLVLPISLILGDHPGSLYELLKSLILMIAVGAVAGVIAAGAFWVSSALLGNVRKAAKGLRGIRDPEFDGPF